MWLFFQTNNKAAPLGCIGPCTVSWTSRQPHTVAVHDPPKLTIMHRQPLGRVCNNSGLSPHCWWPQRRVPAGYAARHSPLLDMLWPLKLSVGHLPLGVAACPVWWGTGPSTGPVQPVGATASVVLLMGCGSTLKTQWPGGCPFTSPAGVVCVRAYASVGLCACQLPNTLY